MKPDNANKINYIGIFIWIILYWFLIPIKIIRKYPIILVGYIYTIFILYSNILLTGKDDVDFNNMTDLNPENTITLTKIIDSRAGQVSTAIFALSIACKDIFKAEFDKEMLPFIIYSLLFGVAVILPIYFISHNKNKDVNYRYNNNFIRIRNVSLSYSVGFMVSAFMIALNRLFKLIK